MPDRSANRMKKSVHFGNATSYSALVRCVTRAAVAMERAVRPPKLCNRRRQRADRTATAVQAAEIEAAPTPLLIIGVPVGFVNVVEAKEQIMTAGVPYIAARGRKGGSNVAAAICNAAVRSEGEIQIRRIL